MGINTIFGVERIEHEIMKLVCGVCIRVQARWDINRSMTVRYVNKKLIPVIIKYEQVWSVYKSNS